ncbi:MAG TPA: SpoIID/LytB domain-containing protein [Stenomitos sp.]
MQALIVPFLALVLACFLSGPAAAQVPLMRVGVSEGVTKAVVATSVSGVILDAGGRTVGTTQGMEGWEAHREAGGIGLFGRGGRLVVAGPWVRFVPRPGSGEIGLAFGGGRWYRGEIEVRSAGSRLTVINRVPLEQYLYGVVPAEMNPRWSLEALKAQAVAARTYALAKLGQFNARGFDLKPTTENQVYRGAGVETSTSNMAVDQTLGQVLTRNGHVIAAYFHSSSGGYTETSAAVWGEPRPYLQAVPDYDQQSPRYLWQKNVPSASVRSGLAREGLAIGDPVRFEVLERSYSGRVHRIRVIGTGGERVVSGDVVRRAAGLYSTLFNVIGYGGSGGRPAAFAFAGRGHGHGLGLSQWGAKALGERGYTYQQILAYYYPTTQLSSIGGGDTP